MNDEMLLIKLKNYQSPLHFSGAEQRFISLNADETNREALCLEFEGNDFDDSVFIAENNFGILALVPEYNNSYYRRSSGRKLAVDPGSIESISILEYDTEDPPDTALPDDLRAIIQQPVAAEDDEDQVIVIRRIWDLAAGSRYQITSVASGQGMDVEVSAINESRGVVLTDGNTRALDFSAFTWRLA